MIDELKPLAIFNEVVEQKSFRAAAKKFGLAPSVISHHITSLEERYEIPLLYRSTRKLSLTKEGEQLYKQTKHMVEAAKNSFNLIAKITDQPAGHLTISLPAMLKQHKLVHIIGMFLKKYPEIKMSLSFTDQQENIIDKGIDIAFRLGKLKDSSLIVRKVLSLKRVLIIDKKTYSKLKPLKHPKELSNLKWIGISMRKDEKEFISKTGKKISININPQIHVNDIAAAIELTKEGVGFCTPLEFMVEQDIKKGKLITPLKTYQVTPIDLYALWPKTVSEKELTKLLLNYIIEKLNL